MKRIEDVVRMDESGVLTCCIFPSSLSVSRRVLDLDVKLSPSPMATRGLTLTEPLYLLTPHACWSKMCLLKVKGLSITSLHLQQEDHFFGGRTFLWTLCLRSNLKNCAVREQMRSLSCVNIHHTGPHACLYCTSVPNNCNKEPAQGAKGISTKLFEFSHYQAAARAASSREHFTRKREHVPRPVPPPTTAIGRPRTPRHCTPLEPRDFDIACER